MQITGDPNPLDRPLNVPVDQVGDIYIVDGGSSPIQKFSRNCSVYVADRSNLCLQVFDTINYPKFQYKTPHLGEALDGGLRYDVGNSG